MRCDSRLISGPPFLLYFPIFFATFLVLSSHEPSSTFLSSFSFPSILLALRICVANSVTSGILDFLPLPLPFLFQPSSSTATPSGPVFPFGGLWLDLSPGKKYSGHFQPLIVFSVLPYSIKICTKSYASSSCFFLSKALISISLGPLSLTASFKLLYCCISIL